METCQSGLQQYVPALVLPRLYPVVLAVGRIGGNLNQIARWLNRAMLAGRADLGALTVARRLLTIERQLAQIVEAARRC